MEALVYLPDIDTLQRIHADWPDEMRAILCLHDDGRCDIRIHHVEEGDDAALGEVIEQIGVADDRIQVVPKTGAYPSRRMRFAEEQALCQLLDEITHLPKLATDHALDYRYRKEAATSRELSERADRLAERVQRRRPSDRDDNPLIIAHLSEDAKSHRFFLSDGTPPLQSGREILGRVVEVGSDSASVHISWEGNVEYNDVILIPRSDMPSPVAELFAKNNMRARLHLTPRGAMVVPDYTEREEGATDAGQNLRRRLAKGAAAAMVLVSAGALTAGVAAAFG